ncbi:hypothetical protein ABB37_08743 [Leptomonas pyrrhocoris]|uniref:MIF4G domain-containing protein n=1 Tax=Leptomonas pyrrhocoris TaxID=157538 RepID=A0A0N0DRW8_LEPPY|nr:hypothetical protein ABB37_08743 [Leptomonas pyrrhocoris]XP_015653500.1 hypothetical protein ABB37_08743 [Leptomonas pyrrhocoris]KPA75060.1 hypothetical protein ABB37_08743 [Leptomonas pyrrhocoris]KPA75061.1 hypothetical protein ABB37_08743 [Leptomonas pyrrhocoris]|eukprot:XP_015653499.1 hypothetical protein ABB37_08743 [Leptomonas pyrrhocoris]
MERRYQSSCSSPRSRSAPKGGRSPRSLSSFYAFPSTLQDILYGPRQRLTKYADGMRVLPASPSPLRISTEKDELEDADKAVEVEVVALSKDSNVVDAAPVDVPLDNDKAAATAEEPASELVSDAAQEDDTHAEDAVKAEMAIPGEATTATPVVAAADDAAAAEAVQDDVEESDSTPAPVADEKTGEAVAAGVADAEEEKSEQLTAGEETEKRADSAAVVDESHPFNTPSAHEEEEETKSDEKAKDAVEQPEDLPPLLATAECIAFDPAQVEAWMSDCRHDTAHVPAGVNAFVRSFDAIAAKFNLKIAVTGAASSTLTAGGTPGKKGKKGSSFTTAAMGGAKGGVSGSPMELAGRDGGFGGAVAPHAGSGNAGGITHTNGGGAGAGAKKSNALEALGDVWEGRQEIPISLAPGTIRRRGLFGEVEKKKIHHMVVAVLNKVTTDPAKFREVKNELLRLPIPEANAEQLTKIVDAFFSKAVREQHFSHSYADLIVALCKVPQGQHIVGDKTQSLEYRLRVALLKRCQSEFEQSVSGDGNGSHGTPKTIEDVTSPLTSAIQRAVDAGGETEKERRDRMCGNVRFVCELFLRDVVVGSVISFIFRVCLLGSEFGEFTTPPNYTPTELQIDEVITAVRAVKDRFFVQKSEGRRMLPLVLGQLAYWVQHFPVSRCRFVLMSTVEDLRTMLPAPEVTAITSAAPAAAAAPQPATASSVTSEGTAPSVSGPSEMALVTTTTTTTTAAVAAAVTASPNRLPVPPEVSESISGSPMAVTVSVGDGSQSLMTSTMVGGQPLPAPRSKQTGNASVSDSVSSLTGTAAVVEPAVVESAVVSPLLSIMLTLCSRPLLQAVRPEAIAKFMAALSSGQCTPTELARQLFDQYGNVLPVLAAWLDRCLSVTKEEKSRMKTGALFVACAAHLTAHLSPTSAEWAKTMSACREQVHEVAIEALQRAMEGKLHEDLHIFQFWAQLVLSDHDRVVYDEELLNEGLELVAYTTPTALRNYLVEVSKYVNQVLVNPDSLPWHPAMEAHRFVRFRPLLVLHTLVLAGGAKEAQAVLDSALSFADVRKQSLEMRLYYTFRNGAASHENVFEQLRKEPRLTSRDPTLAAEVLSAMLITELCTEGLALVENNMDLIQITVDGVDRAGREIAVVAEVYEVLHYAPKSLPRTAAGRVLEKFVQLHILSDETMDRADRFFATQREGVMEKPEKESRVLEPPPSTQAATAAAAAAGAALDLPRIADHHTGEEALSASTSLHSVGGSNTGCTSTNNTNNGGPYAYGGHTNVSGSAEGAVVDFRANTVGSNSVEGIPSSSASSVTEYRQHNPDQLSRHPHQHHSNSNVNTSHSDDHSNYGDRSRRKRGSSELSSQPSLRPTSPSHSHDDASKRLYRNSYKNRRRGHEGGSEMPSSRGESKEVSPPQPPVAHTPSSTHDNSSLENSHVGSNSTSRYNRGGHHNNNSSSITSGGSRGVRGGGHAERGSSRGGRGGRSGANVHRGGRGGRGARDDSRRGNGRYNSRGSGGGSRD